MALVAGGGRFRLLPQIVAGGGLLRLPAGDREGIQAHRRQHPVPLKGQGAAAAFVLFRLCQTGDAIQIPQVPAELLRVPGRGIQQEKGQEGAALRPGQGGLPLLGKGEIPVEQDQQLVLSPDVVQPQRPVRQDREPLQGQPLRTQARLGGQEGPAPAVQLRQPPHQLPHPGERKLGQRRLVQEEPPQQAAALIGQPEGAVGGVRLPSDGIQDGLDGLQILPVAADAGDGQTLFKLALILRLPGGSGRSPGRSSGTPSPPESGPPGSPGGGW